MNAEQLRELIDALPGGGGGRKKLRNFEGSATAGHAGSEWVTWRSHFNTVQQINGWDCLMSRRQLKAAMLGDAARTVADIDIEAAGATIDGILTLYENRFLTAAGGQIARVQFHALRQLPAETVLQFHSRGRELFSRAYPDRANALNNDALLIQTFALGLVDVEVSRYVLDRNPATYVQALEMALGKHSTEEALRAHGRITKGGLHSIQTTTSVICWTCGKRGHVQKDCTERDEGAVGAWRGGRGRGRGRGRRGRGRGGNRNFNSKAQMNSVAESTNQTGQEAGESQEEQAGNC